MKLYFELIMLLSLLVCLIIATISDCKTGKISNEKLIPFFIEAILINIVYYVFIDRKSFYIFIINIGILSLCSLILFFTHIWAGGDCKLIIVSILLVPVSYYWNIDNTKITLWFALVVIFILGFIYILIESIYITIKEKFTVANKQFLKELKLSSIYYIISLIYLTAISQITALFILPYFEIPTIIYTCVCVTVVFVLRSIKILNSKIIVFSFLVFDVAMIFITGNITINRMWSHYCIALLFIIMRILINKYNYKIISVNDLSEGMVLSQQSSLLMQESRVKGLPGVSDETLKSRITKNEVESIRKWSNSKSGFSEIVIVKKLPFAIFILFGFVIYLIVGVTVF